MIFFLVITSILQIWPQGHICKMEVITRKNIIVSNTRFSKVSKQYQSLENLVLLTVIFFLVITSILHIWP